MTGRRRIILRGDRVKARKKVFAVFLMVVFAIAVMAVEAPIASAEPYRHPKTGLVFPDPVGSMKLVKVTDYEPLYAGLGTGISYRTETIRADVFLYDMQKGPVPNGISSPVVADEFEQAIADIYSMEKNGTYKNISTMIKKETVPVGSLKFLHSVLTYEQNNIKLISHLYLTGYGGLFIKLRVTYFTDARVREEANLAMFLTMIGDITKKASR